MPYLGRVKGRKRLLYFVLICALYRIAFVYLCQEICETFDVPSDGVDRDSGGESGHRARAGRDTETKCLSRLKPGVPIHHHCPNPPHLMVNISWSVVFKRFLLYSVSSRRKTQANLVIWGVFLPILEPLEGPPSSTLGNLIFLDTLYH